MAPTFDGGPQSRSVLLAVRIAWFALPLTAGPALAHGLRDASTPVQVVASALAWLAWGGVGVAVLVPRTVSLTALRIGAPAALATSIWAAVRSGDGGVAEIVAIGWTALLAAVVLFVPVVTDLFVDGSSYGPERRMALRTPAPLFLGPVELAWVVVVAGLAAGPLLLAAHSWVLGVIALAAGAVLVRPAARSLHQLSRRWVVFVRVGFVLHDPRQPRRPGALPEAGRALAGTSSRGRRGRRHRRDRSSPRARARAPVTDEGDDGLGPTTESEPHHRHRPRAVHADSARRIPQRGARARDRLTASPPPTTSSPS